MVYQDNQKETNIFDELNHHPGQLELRNEMRWLDMAWPSVVYVLKTGRVCLTVFCIPQGLAFRAASGAWCVYSWSSGHLFRG